MNGFVSARIDDGASKIVCPVNYLGCGNEVSPSELKRLLRPEVFERYSNLLEKHEQPKKATSINAQQTVPCPVCEAAVPVSGKSNRKTNDLTCTACTAQFCRVHGLDHVGVPCEKTKPPLRQELQNWWWQKWHTRKCPRCGHRIQKNGGCNHMTCRCGHEICWRCGGDYVKHGRRGHSDALFPRPSELKYCCNNARQWAERVGAVALLSTVGVAAVTIYCAGKITKEVLFKTYDVAAYTPRRIGQALKHRRQKRKRRPHPQDCAHYFPTSTHRYGIRDECIFCGMTRGAFLVTQAESFHGTVEGPQDTWSESSWSSGDEEDIEINARTFNNNNAQAPANETMGGFIGNQGDSISERAVATAKAICDVVQSNSEFGMVIVEDLDLIDIIAIVSRFKRKCKNLEKTASIETAAKNSATAPADLAIGPEQKDFKINSRSVKCLSMDYGNMKKYEVNYGLVNSFKASRDIEYPRMPTMRKSLSAPHLTRLTHDTTFSIELTARWEGVHPLMTKTVPEVKRDQIRYDTLKCRMLEETDWTALFHKHDSSKEKKPQLTKDLIMEKLVSGLPAENRIVQKQNSEEAKNFPSSKRRMVSNVVKCPKHNAGMLMSALYGAPRRICVVSSPYSGEHENELNITVGDEIEVVSTGDGKWWLGCLGNHSMGWFPAECASKSNEPCTSVQSEPWAYRVEAISPSGGLARDGRVQVGDLLVMCNGMETTFAPINMIQTEVAHAEELLLGFAPPAQPAELARPVLRMDLIYIA